MVDEAGPETASFVFSRLNSRHVFPIGMKNIRQSLKDCPKALSSRGAYRESCLTALQDGISCLDEPRMHDFLAFADRRLLDVNAGLRMGGLDVPEIFLRRRFYMQILPAQSLAIENCNPSDSVMQAYTGLVGGAVKALPWFIRAFMDDFSFMILTGKTMKDIRRYAFGMIKGNEPFNDEYAGGIFWGKDYWIGIPRNPLDKKGAVMDVPTRFPQLVHILAHEIGHGIDRAFGFPSKSDAFMQLYKQDCLDIVRAKSEKIPSLSYYLAGVDGGQHDDFASAAGEAFAELCAEDVTKKKLIDMSFPRTYCFVRSICRALEAQYHLWPDMGELPRVDDMKRMLCNRYLTGQVVIPHPKAA